MKRTLILIVLISCCQCTKAQSWAAPGATWYYNFMYFSAEGFERIEKVGDTIIGSYLYDKFSVRYYWYDFAQQNSGILSYADEFIREDSGIVYRYRDTAEFILYNFNANPGDSWLACGDDMAYGACDTSTIKVDSINTIVINGDTLRVLHTSPMYQLGSLALFGPVVEKIGCMMNMFPAVNCIMDIPYGFGLRCYFDSTGWTYHDQVFYDPHLGCDYVQGIRYPEQRNFLKIHPVPADNSIFIDHTPADTGDHLLIHDAFGRTIKDIELRSGKEIDVSGLPDGIYFLNSAGDTFRPVRFVVIHN